MLPKSMTNYMSSYYIQHNTILSNRCANPPFIHTPYADLLPENTKSLNTFIRDKQRLTPVQLETRKQYTINNGKLSIMSALWQLIYETKYGKLFGLSSIGFIKTLPKTFARLCPAQYSLTVQNRGQKYQSKHYHTVQRITMKTGTFSFS